MQLNFCMQINIKASYKLISTGRAKSFLQGAIIINRHDQAFSKVTCLQYIYKVSKKKLRLDFIFYMQMNTGFCKLTLLFLMEVARHVQSTRIRMLLILLQYLKIIINEVYLLHVDKHEISLEVDMNIEK